ncbi:zinc-dependent metalloprotease [Lewinella sp. W8]|uniref:zinc-dependent metalloprotease n=1 Tax=Lewinella sp. W8 TaxID=2528208 RepID=UPI00106756A2|nr:zinc-dependent metalloprotease [Lewinella sp. W8]MTB52494.1 DUF5117 domain-containing protein [Lewinella sp. W8]
MLIRLLLLLCALYLPCTGARAQTKAPKQPPSIAEKVEGMDKKEGFFDFYWDDDAGKVYLSIDRWNEDFLYVNSLAAGLGSNDIGLDRNQLGGTRVVYFRRIGDKVLLTHRNLDYRAVSDNPDERASVADAFAQSVIYGFKIAAKTDDQVLIDLTPMLLTDAHGVAGRLRGRKQGTYKVAADRSAVYADNTKNFPKNSEFEALVTFTGQATGSQLRSVTPTSGSFSLRMHHSFIELPDDDYQPRVFDPRSGYFPMSYADYATPIAEPLMKRFIRRHRLEKKDPTAAMSEPVEPIVYYLDRGAPEPIRSALLEGARWWNQAFEAAGYKDAFRVEVLPEDADPLDVRYNVINWVHRSTRGWSYGSSVTDPRTGEIIKGHVLLGSLRVRQDFLLAQGLIRAYEDGTTPDPRLEEMALARLRQLSAHEVGHTIGLAHNFAASVNDRASVMDYPHPYIQLKDGVVDFSEAYDTGIGEWDKRTILYGYQDFPAGTNEATALREIVEENERMGLHYLSDSDARPPGSAQPQAHLWDNGKNAAAEMRRMLALRRHAMENFGPWNVPLGAPMAEMEKVFVPVYLMHRYQVEAVSKSIGGYYYRYAARQAGQNANVLPVPQGEQLSAFSALMATLRPDQLMVPDELLAYIPPPATGYGRDRELFKTQNGGGFDPLAMAQAAADNSLRFLLEPHRLARVAEQHALYPDQEFTSLERMLQQVSRTLDRNVQENRQDEYALEIGLLVQKRLVAHLIQLAANDDISERVRAAAMAELKRLEEDLYTGERDNYNALRGHRDYLDLQIRTFFNDPTSVKISTAPGLPDGSPIGCGGM